MKNRDEPNDSDHGEPGRGRVGLADVLRHPHRLADLDRHAIAMLLAEPHAVEGRLVDRLLVLDAQRDTTDELRTIDETATYLRVTRDWLRRRTLTSPFVVKVSDGVVRYSKKQLQAWLARRAGGRL